MSLAVFSAIALAVSQDEAKELYETAMAYELGNDSISPDLQRSLSLYRKSAEEGYLPAQNYLGFLYYKGEGMEKNVDSALFWIEKAAMAGDIKAAGNMGYLLSEAPDIEHDYSKAFLWLSKAAEAGLQTSFTQLADLYRQGLGVAPDTLKATALYERALKSRIPDAQQRLLAMMGYKWKELSPDSALHLGLKYYTEGAPVIGVELFENAAAGGNAKAMTLIGDAYSRGIGINYNHDRAFEYFLRGALQGDPSAQFVVAETLEILPDIITPELLENLSPKIFASLPPGELLTSPQYWYEKAAESGITDADRAYDVLFAGD